jgi:hypothetical protein
MPSSVETTQLLTMFYQAPSRISSSLSIRDTDANRDA